MGFLHSGAIGSECGRTSSRQACSRSRYLGSFSTYLIAIHDLQV